MRRMVWCSPSKSKQARPLTAPILSKTQGPSGLGTAAPPRDLQALCARIRIRAGDDDPSIAQLTLQLFDTKREGRVIPFPPLPGAARRGKRSSHLSFGRRLR